MAMDKQTALDTAIKQLEKQFGKGAVMRLGENKHMNVEHISTGSLSLDVALGIGGLPRGRIVEIYGPESSGKTTLSLHCIAEGQKNGGNVAFIDVEHALDPVYAEALGVNINELLVSQPDTGEDALEIAEGLIRSGAIDVIVIDSVAALVPKAEIEGEMGDSHVGLHARLMSQALRKLAGAINKSNCVAIFINQLREKVGVIYGNPEVTTVGNHTKAKVVKNKLAPPFKVAEFDIMYGEGISREGELLDMAVEAEVVQKAGAWFSYKTQRLGQGRDKVKELFRTDPELAKQIEEELWANIDKLYAKSMPKSKAKAAAAAEAKAEEPAPEEKPAAKKASSSKAASSKPVNIDIMVEE